MGKRGIALIMAFFVILFISILGASFFARVMNENRLVNRYVNSTRALWLAEAGVSKAIGNMPNPVSGTIGNANWQYNVPAPTHIGSGEYYQINSTGSVVTLFGTISRSLSVIARTDPVSPDNFQHAIRTTSNLRIGGSAEVNGPQEEFASLNFANLFEHSKDEVKSFATHLYTNPPVDVTPVNGITWVDCVGPNPPSLKISSSGWSGSGILVVSGDAEITGGIFNGIIYVIGKLRMAGNPIINGTILAESQIDIDTTIVGNVTINYDRDAIIAALQALQFLSPVVVSWQEN